MASNSALMLLKRALASESRILPAKSITPDMLLELDALRRNDPFVFSGISARRSIPDKPWIGKYTSQFFSEDPYVAANYVEPRGVLWSFGFRPKGIELRELTGEGTPIVQNFRRVQKSPGEYVDLYGDNGYWETIDRMERRRNPDPRAMDVIEMSMPNIPRGAPAPTDFWKLLNVRDTALTPDMKNTKEVYDPVQYWIPNLDTKRAVLKKRGGAV